MIESIKKMFKLGTKTDYGELIKQGAIILDVRSKAEFSGGHIENSINIPVDQLSNNLSKLQNKESSLHAVTASQEQYCGVSSMLKKALPVTWEVNYNGTQIFNNKKEIVAELN